MKKLVKNHKFIQKIFLSIIMMLLLSFSVPVRSQADIGGILISPLVDLIGTVADVCVGGLQAFLVNGEMNNSKDMGGPLNAFLVDREKFVESIEAGEATYQEFKYSAENGEAKISISEDEIEKKYAIPAMKYSPEKIFGGKVPALDINFVDPKDWESEEMNERSIAIALHETIASWYVALRNLAVVALMLVLVYIGIRIVISSTASDKAKYKQMLMDWLIAMCILFCLHYIMTFTTTIVNEITQAISGSASNSGNNIAVQVADGTEFNTDLMGLIRFKLQSPDMSEKVLYLLLYLAMAMYTFMFTFYYLKRVLTIAFLTLISPMVALTYPIDKMKDGKAQAFDMWIKEYIFNVLLQPFHLIIYTIFVGSAIELATKNPLFAIVALAFITPAEKILRKFFGFEKASTAGALGTAASVAGGAALMNHMKNLMAPKKGTSSKKPVRTKDRLERSAPPIGDAFGQGKGREANEAFEQGQENPPALGGTQDGDETDASRATREWLHGGSTESGGTTTASNPQESESKSESTPEPTGGENPRPLPPPRKTTSEGSSGIHGQGAGQWTDDDKRGVLQWMGDTIAGSKPGQGAIKLGRTLGNMGRGVRDMAAQSAVGRAYKSIPKPIRNSVGRLVKGTGNVALRTGMAVGKAALKAAPGALIGMAAGIASDELGDIGKYTLAGAALSSTVGASALGQAGSFIADAYRQGAGTSNTAELKQRQESYVRDNEELYRQEFPDASRGELKAKLKQGAYYDSMGIQGKDSIEAVNMQERIKKEMEASGMSEDDANKRAQAQTAAIMKEAREYSAKDLVDTKKVDSLRNNLLKRLEGKGLSEREKNSTADMIIREMKKARGVSEE